MKKAIYLIIALIGLSAPSCSDSMLDFSPTDSGSGKELLKSASTAITSVNGVYRSMWTAGWSTTANTHQCFGIAAYNLALDCMADDLIMQSQGNGWFWGDHCHDQQLADRRLVLRHQEHHRRLHASQALAQEDRHRVAAHLRHAGQHRHVQPHGRHGPAV